jgi:hypothetical protein
VLQSRLASSWIRWGEVKDPEGKREGGKKVREGLKPEWDSLKKRNGLGVLGGLYKLAAHEGGGTCALWNLDVSTSIVAANDSRTPFVARAQLGTIRDTSGKGVLCP